MLTLFIVAPFCLSQICFYASAQDCSHGCFPANMDEPTPSYDCRRCSCSGRPNCFYECGGDLSGRTGFLVFPGYPKIYNPDEYCTWTFDYPSTTTILVRFISISLRPGDYVEIDDVQFGGKALPYSYVGELNSNDKIIFSSKAYGGKSHGFLLQYQAISGTPSEFSFVSSDRVVLRKGATLSLFCRARGTPAPIVRWEQDGKAVNASTGAPTGEELRRDSVQITDAGIYECIAENALGVVRRSFFLAIHVPPTIINSPVDVHLEYYLRGQQVFFRCDADGAPKPDIRWIKDGQSLSASVDFYPWLHVKLSNSSFGSYSCVARNLVGSIQSAPAVLSTENDGLSSDCHAAYFEEANFSLLLQTYCFWRFDLNGTVANFTSPTSKDFADFSSFVSRLTNLGKPGIYNFSGNSTVANISFYSAVQIRGLPNPKIIHPKFPNVSIDPTSHLLLICADARSNLSPTFTWYYDGVMIDSNETESHVIFHYDQKSYLSVKDVPSMCNITLESLKETVTINFTCQSKVSSSNKSSIASILVSLDAGRTWPWTGWSSPSQCSVTCGGQMGVRLRSRTCIRSTPCEGSSKHIESCRSSNSKCFYTDADAYSIIATATTTENSVSSSSSSGGLIIGVVGAALLIAVLVSVTAIWWTRKLRNQRPTSSHPVEFTRKEETVTTSQNLNCYEETPPPSQPPTALPHDERSKAPSSPSKKRKAPRRPPPSPPEPEYGNIGTRVDEKQTEAPPAYRNLGVQEISTFAQGQSPAGGGGEDTINEYASACYY